MTIPPTREVAPVSERFDLCQSAIALLAGASKAAADVARNQAVSIDRAAKLLEKTARKDRTIWLAGDAADEHQRRLEAAGHRAICMVDPTALPVNLDREDLLLVNAVEDIPALLVSEARERGLDTLLLKGPTPVDTEADVTIMVDHPDPQVVELTHDFIVTALCAQGLAWESSETAA